MQRKLLRLVPVLSLTLLLFILVTPGRAQPPAAPPFPNNPIMFVTQAPVPGDFTSIGSTFGNHRGSLDSVARGGDLWIRYPNGALKNLTAAAGYGGSGFLTGNKGIAVRDPSPSWDGTKVIFSMVVGAPTEQYDYESYYWQLYEVTGFQNSAGTVVITKVPNQPQNYNNVSPIYAPNGRILFISDRPRNGQAHLYPQLDEYEEAPSNTGIWSMNPAVAGGDLKLLDHSPSGDFDPVIDSFGRVIFTRWDHLQRDQQADTDNEDPDEPYGTFNYADESAGAARLNSRAEVFPEPRYENGNLNRHIFNHFFPWQINLDGTELETLNHVGRHELTDYLGETFTDDPNLIYYADPNGHSNQNFIIGDGGVFHLQESPTQAGLYYATHAPEFGSHSAGQLVTLTGAPSLNGDQMQITYLTHPSTLNQTATPGPFHSGHYRDPLPLSNGTLIAAHTAETREDRNEGSTSAPQSRYAFRLKTLTTTVTSDGTYWVPAQTLTSGISKTFKYWSPDVMVEYSGLLWELNPVEIRARPVPPSPSHPLPGPEQQIFDQVGVVPANFQNYLTQNNLALVVSRNVTTRDDLDRQQPFNLKIRGSNTQTIGAPGKIYEVAYLQFFQADQLRGLTFGGSQPRPGRRVLAQPMHDTASAAENLPSCAVPPGSVRLAADGSMAAFVPARRAMTWQLTDGSGNGVVRERFWLTFQPGEIRVCASCHGLNEKDQAGHAKPTNPPEALRELLEYWQDSQSVVVTCNRVYLPTILQ